MTFTELEQLIKLGEGFSLEFKRKVNSSLGKELCAFGNAMGGKVLIGISDEGQILGVSNHNKLKSEIQSIAHD
jgi:ATP-dependent DNA helicase RecG